MMRKLCAILVTAALTATPVLAQNRAPAANERIAQPPPPAAQEKLQPQIPPPEALLILIRSATLALHDANVTGNYTVLRDLGAPGFQTANSAARLSAVFTSLREQNIDLSAAAILTPQLTQGPVITGDGMLGVAGIFPAQPMQINFQLLFQPVAGRWRLFGLTVNAVQPPMASASAVQQAGPSAAQTKDAKPAANGAKESGGARKAEQKKP